MKNDSAAMGMPNKVKEPLSPTWASMKKSGFVSRFPVNSGGIDVSQETVVLKVDQPYPNHNGGQILFGPDGTRLNVVGAKQDADTLKKLFKETFHL